MSINNDTPADVITRNDIHDFLNSPDAKLAVAIAQHFRLPYAGNIVFDEELMAMLAKHRTPSLAAQDGARSCRRCGWVECKCIAAQDGLVDALRALVDEQCDYMRINNLGDPEEQHNIKRARAALAALGE